MSEVYAFKEVVFGDGTVNCEKVTNKPTTLEGYNITDAVTSEYIESNIDATIDAVENNLGEYDYSTATSNRAFYEDALDQILELDAKMISVLEEPVSTLEISVGIVPRPPLA